MYILVYIDKENNREDVVQDEEGNTTFFWLVDVRELKDRMVKKKMGSILKTIKLPI